MSLTRTFACSALMLLASFNLARGADTVLVRGNPPLTQEFIDVYREMWEWYCEVRLTPELQRELQQKYVAHWKKRSPAANNKDVTDVRNMEKEWRNLLDIKGAEQDRKRAAMRDHWMKLLREWKDDWCRVLVRAYEDAYKPGGTKNPILVAGDPPLTQRFIDVETAFLEVLLDLRLTVKQRQEHQRHFIDLWKGWNREERSNGVKGNNKWAALLPACRDYGRHLTRALSLPKELEAWDKSKDHPYSRWRLELYESSTKPGSDRNPVLVAVKPALTQLVVDRYGDYVEVMFDMSVSGGLTARQRQVLRDYLVEDWKKMTADDRQALLADLKRWADAAGAGVDEAKKCIGALRPKFLARLQTADNRESSKWLLEIVAQERQKADAVAKDQQMMFDAMRYIISKTSPSGYWRTNPTSKGVEWVDR